VQFAKGNVDPRPPPPLWAVSTPANATPKSKSGPWDLAPMEGPLLNTDVDTGHKLPCPLNQSTKISFPTARPVLARAVTTTMIWSLVTIAAVLNAA
jgi:hypothetical protein